LVIKYGKARRVADPAIGAAGVEAERGKAALKFLDLGEGGRRLAVGKLLDERRTADASIAEIAKTERITQCRIVTARGEKIRAEKEGRAARNRQPGARTAIRLREGLAVSARDAERLPVSVTARGGAANRPLHAYFVTPMLATTVIAAFHEITRGRGERVVRRTIG
jgi:hypothetical protein